MDLVTLVTEESPWELMTRDYLTTVVSVVKTVIFQDSGEVTVQGVQG